jgi:RNA polymerase sigma-70 factor, ECF subfamily
MIDNSDRKENGDKSVADDTTSDGIPLEPSHNEPGLLAIFEANRARLFSVAYRMLGSRVDAEDMLQETYLRWRRASAAEIRDPKAFLVTVITRLCINELQSARVKREQYFGQWLPEPLLASAATPAKMPGLDGSLSMAFLMLLERLTPTERAVFLLREVFEYEYAEIASILDQSEANCRQILRRARQHVTYDRARFEASAEMRERLLQQFLQASSEGDLQGLIALLSEDAVLYTDGGGKATAVPNPVHGAERVARFFVGAPGKLIPKDLVQRLVEINGEISVVAYHETQVYGVLTANISDGKIHNLYIMRNPDKLAGIPNLSL